jgi:hypothetical protein
MPANRFGRLWLRFLLLAAVFLGWALSITASQPAACQARPGTCPLPASFGWAAAGLLTSGVLTLAAGITRWRSR